MKSLPRAAILLVKGQVPTYAAPTPPQELCHETN